jgi:hypothetical protein
MAAHRPSRANAEGPLKLLAARRFGPLFAAQFLSAFNDNALKNALVLMIAYRAGGTAQLSAQLLIPLAGGLFILPFFLFSATAGQLADRHDKAGLIRLIKLCEIAVMLIAAAGVLAHSRPVLLALLCVMGIAAAAFGPLKYAILPDLLAPGELVPGNALVEGGTYLAILLGTIAGVLIASRHGAASVAVLIVAVALAAWGSSRLIPATGAASPQGAVNWNLFAATSLVVRATAADRVPFRAILGISWFWLAGSVYLAQFPGYVRFSLGGEEAIVTLFLGVFTVGIGIGSLLCSRLLRSRLGPRTVTWGAVAIGLCSIDLWLASPAPGKGDVLVGLGAFFAAPPNWRVLADLFGIAVAGGVFVLPLYVLLQAATPRHRRAQAIAANNIVNAAAMVAAAVAMVALGAAGVGSSGLFLLTGVTALAVGLWFRRAPPDPALFLTAGGNAAPAGR